MISMQPEFWTFSLVLQEVVEYDNDTLQNLL